MNDWKKIFNLFGFLGLMGFGDPEDEDEEEDQSQQQDEEEYDDSYDEYIPEDDR